MMSAYIWISYDNPPEVMPLNDLREHTFGYNCWCKPIDDEGVIVHNSMDQRELFENGERLMS